MSQSDEEDSRDEKRSQVQDFLDSAYHTYSDVDRKALAEALYTMNEMGMWDDDIELSSAAFLKAVQLYHALVKHGDFPKNLRM
jgi:hypothetical protein